MIKNRTASWLKSGDENIFFWHHTPEKINKNAAIIIIGPIGPEYMSSHRSIRLLADSLSLLGFHSIRYDPIGMGNSSGKLDDPHIWKNWVESPNILADHLQKKFNINDIILIGLRSGCLVLSEAQQRFSIKSAVFWYPLISGTAFIRGIQLLDSVLYENKEKSNTLEGGGYPFTQELQNDIKKINIVAQNYNSLENALVITSEISELNKLSDKMISSGIKTDLVNLNGLDDMLRQVTLSKIPFQNIKYISTWLEKSNKEQIKNLIECDEIRTNYHHSEFNEEVVSISSSQNIFGVLSTPIIDDREKILVFINTGASHHAGPNRIHIDVARMLAKQGISTLRIDLSNLGDSSESYEIDPPEEYPATATDDILLILTYLKTNLSNKQIVLCGISAGAHNIFHAALEPSCENLCNIILINPETFYWKPDQTIFSSGNPQTEINEIYYRKQIFNYKKWFALIINPTKIYRTLQFLILLLIKKAKLFLLFALGALNIHIKSTLENDIIILANKDIGITLIYSQGDPGYKILMSQASRTIKNLANKNRYSSIQIPNADHTFSSIKSRKNLYMAISDSINKM